MVRGDVGAVKAAVDAGSAAAAPLAVKSCHVIRAHTVMLRLFYLNQHNPFAKT